MLACRLIVGLEAGPTWWYLPEVGWMALGAIGTVGAFAVSLYLLGQQLWTTGAESRTKQARLVAAWIDQFDADGTPTADCSVLVCNGSDEPVFGVILQVPLGVRGTFVRHVGVLGPHETRELTIVAPAVARRENPAPELGFTDIGGRTWIRMGRTGQLRETSRHEMRTKLGTERPGAFTTESHPTLKLGHTPQAQRGRRISGMAEVVTDER